MRNPKHLLIFIIILLILSAIYWVRNKDNVSSNQNDDAPVVAVEANPVDTVMDFFRPWLNAITDPETDPYTKELPARDVLTTELRDKILAAQTDFESGDIDPVLCTTVLPDGLKTKTILRQADSAQILVLSRDEVPRALAVAKLTGVDGQWKIADIDCNAGEQGPELGEFTFDKEGFLLKESVQPPLDPTKWYVVYERDGVLGYTAVLNLNENSTCADSDGSSMTCGDGGFAEAMQVSVKGDMQEAGVDVVSVTVLE